MSLLNPTLDEKKELIVESFANTFDKMMAYEKAGVTEDEFEILEKDLEFQARLNFYIIKEREKIIRNFRTFMDANDEKVAYTATKEYAKLLYPEYFLDPGLGKMKISRDKRGEYDLKRLSDEELYNIAKQVK